MEQLLRRGLIITLTGLFILIGTQSCNDDYESVVPYVPVDYTLNPTNIIELNIPGGTAYLRNLGYGGIIVFRDMMDSQNPFLAYDATCTFDLPSIYRVDASDGSGIARCPQCGSEYILFGGNGSPTKGPAVEPLKQYHVTFNGSYIYIKN